MNRFQFICDYLKYAISSGLFQDTFNKAPYADCTPALFIFATTLFIFFVDYLTYLCYNVNVYSNTFQQ